MRCSVSSHWVEQVDGSSSSQSSSSSLTGAVRGWASVRGLQAGGAGSDSLLSWTNDLDSFRNAVHVQNDCWVQRAAFSAMRRISRVEIAVITALRLVKSVGINAQWSDYPLFPVWFKMLTGLCSFLLTSLPAVTQSSAAGRSKTYGSS